MKRFLIILACLVAVVFAVRLCVICISANSAPNVDTSDVYDYCKRNGYSTDYCFLVDFSKPSGVDRFYVYSFKERKIVYKSLCAHGLGKNYNIFKTTFSNEVGCNYSSLGHYKVGDLRKMSSPRRKVGYTLYGLDQSNSNAFERAILIHDGNPEFQTFPFPCLPMSQGCFAVSTSMMMKIAQVECESDKPILLYAYK